MGDGSRRVLAGRRPVSRPLPWLPRRGRPQRKGGALMATPKPTITASTLADAIDTATQAHFRAVGFAAVLARFAELQEANTDPENRHYVDTRLRDEHLWYGIRAMSEDIEQSCNTMYAALKAGSAFLMADREKGGTR